VHHARKRPEFPESAITVALSEGSGSTVVWRIRIDVETTGGRSRLGTILTAPPAGKRLGTRVVCLASCPGAVAWDILAEPLAPHPVNVGATLRVESCEDPGELALVPCDGSLVVAGPETGPGAGAYNQATGVGVGVAVVPIGARVRGWSFTADPLLPATAAIVSPIFGALPLITLPAGGSFGDNPENLIGPATIAFAGAPAAWWVSWRELG
jgi:hypothetical protein